MVARWRCCGFSVPLITDDSHPALTPIRYEVLTRVVELSGHFAVGEAAVHCLLDFRALGYAHLHPSTGRVGYFVLLDRRAPFVDEAASRWISGAFAGVTGKNQPGADGQFEASDRLNV